MHRADLDRARALACAALLATLVVPARGGALNARVGDWQTTGGVVRASLELRAVFSDRFRRLLEGGGTLHVRVEAELWEDRALWDRLVRPAITFAFRVARDPATQAIAVVDPFGSRAAYPGYPDPLLIRLDVARPNEIDDDRRYYLHALVTAGILAEREIDGVGDAVFGTDEEQAGLTGLGKYLFRKVLQVSDYLQSESCEVTSAKLRGRDLKPGR